MKSILITSILLLGAFVSNAQVVSPVHFSYSSHQDTLQINATIDAGWHLYAVHLPNPNEGPLPTEIIFEPSLDYSIVGDLIESKGHTEVDDAFGIEVTYFEKSASFKQAIIPIAQKSFPVLGVINYMVCNDEMCVPFEETFEFQFQK